MYLYELGTRPWEAPDEETKKRIEAYESWCKAAVATNLVLDNMKKIKK